jgi:hypothetical protein
MVVVLCSLSPKRRASLEAEPKLLRELLEARHESEIPGLVDLDNTWDALDRLLCNRVEGTALADAVVARSGRKLKARGAFGEARLLEPERVVEVNEALAALPDDFVSKRFHMLLGKEVHGNFGQERSAPDDNKWLRQKVEDARKAEIETLHGALGRLRKLYGDTARAGHALMSVVT